MIDWLVQNTIPGTIILLLIMAIRIPTRNLLGAHISYALWSLPVMILIAPWLTEFLPSTGKLLVWDKNIQSKLLQTLTKQTESTSINWIALTWLSGFVLMTGYKLWHAVKFKYLAQLNATGATHEQLKLWGIKTGRVRIATSTQVQSPCITGYARPTVYLPTGFESEFTVAQQKLILQHELQHHKKGDLWFLLMVEIYSCMFWFNPLIHLFKKYFITDQELACDRQVLKNASQQTRLVYGQALHQGLLSQLSPIQSTNMALSFFSVKHQRFTMLNKHKNNNSKTFIGFTLITLLIFTASVFSHNMTENQSDEHEVSFNFIDAPLPVIIHMISESTDVEEQLINAQLLKGKFSTFKANHEKAFEVLDDILAEHDLQVTRTKKTWTFSKL